MIPTMRGRTSGAIPWVVVVLGAAWSFTCARTSATGGPTARPPAPATPPPPAISADRALGTPHPTVLLGAAGDGSWLAICQARADTDHDGDIEVGFGIHGEVGGDRLVPYLLLGPGPGREITRFLRSDRSGRWLVYVRDGKRWLLDAHAGGEIDLDGAHPSRRAVSGAGDLARNETWTAGLDFDDEGKHLLFVASDARGRRVAVLRRLADGRETEIEHGPALLLWTGFAKEGPYILMRTVERDTNGNGALDPPRTFTDRDTGPCSTRFAASLTASEVSDEVSWRVARIDERSARVVPGFETVFGDAVVRRADSGALQMEGKGSVRELVPAACDAHVALANPSRDTLVVSCAREGNALYVLQGGQRLATGCLLKDPGVDHHREMVRVTCADSPGRKQDGFISAKELEIRIVLPDGKFDGTQLVRSALAGPGAAWQRGAILGGVPKILPPNVELCSRYWTVDLESGQPNPPSERRVTRGTTSGQVLAASGVRRRFSDVVALGPLFWTAALDPGASCPTFEQKREEFHRRHPNAKPR